MLSSISAGLYEAVVFTGTGRTLPVYLLLWSGSPLPSCLLPLPRGAQIFSALLFPFIAESCKPCKCHEIPSCTVPDPSSHGWAGPHPPASPSRPTQSTLPLQSNKTAPPPPRLISYRPVQATAGIGIDLGHISIVPSSSIPKPTLFLNKEKTRRFNRPPLRSPPPAHDSDLGAQQAVQSEGGEGGWTQPPPPLCQEDALPVAERRTARKSRDGGDITPQPQRFWLRRGPLPRPEQALETGTQAVRTA